MTIVIVILFVALLPIAVDVFVAAQDRRPRRRTVDPAAPLWRQFLDTPMPDPDAAFLDGRRLSQCCADLGDDTERIKALISAYWRGDIATTEFVCRFNSGDWPAAKPGQDERGHRLPMVSPESDPDEYPPLYPSPRP